MRSLTHSRTEKSPKITSSAEAPDPGRPNDWRKYFTCGREFLQAASRDCVGRQRFSGDVIFDLVSMAVENFLYAGCLAHGHLPANGCLMALAQETGQVVFLSADCRESIRALVGMKDICSLFPSEAVPPVPAAKIPELINIGVIVYNEIDNVLDRVCPEHMPAAISSGDVFAEELFCIRKGA